MTKRSFGDKCVSNREIGNEDHPAERLFLNLRKSADTPLSRRHGRLKDGEYLLRIDCRAETLANRTVIKKLRDGCQRAQVRLKLVFGHNE